ncbi:MAG: hypothetical protein J5548_03915 [Prevotella sp.]|nr:hypothetical protein [Prevotella sp.]
MRKKTRWKANVILGMFLFLATTMMAVPVKRGIWRDLTLTNGKEVKAQLVGDEWFHYYADADGNAYVEKGQGKYKKVSKGKLERMRKKSQKRRNTMMGR